MKARVFFVLVVTTAAAVAAQPLDRVRLAAEVREEFLHAWNGYETYA